MADSELPLDSGEGLYPNYSMGVTIEGVNYIFNMRWNERDEAWYFDLLDSSADPIISGVKVVLGVLLGRRCTDPRYPKGALFASDLSGEHREATLRDFGSRVKMYFRPAGDIT